MPRFAFAKPTYAVTQSSKSTQAQGSPKHPHCPLCQSISLAPRAERIQKYQTRKQPGSSALVELNNTMVTCAARVRSAKQFAKRSISKNVAQQGLRPEFSCFSKNGEGLKMFSDKSNGLTYPRDETLFVARIETSHVTVDTCEKRTPRASFLLLLLLANSVSTSFDQTIGM